MEQVKRGKFITFEGCDGCGKSTQLKLLSEFLSQEGIPHIFTREPGGGKISEAIREAQKSVRYAINKKTGNRCHKVDVYAMATN